MKLRTRPSSRADQFSCAFFQSISLAFFESEGNWNILISQSPLPSLTSGRLTPPRPHPQPSQGTTGFFPFLSTAQTRGEVIYSCILPALRQRPHGLCLLYFSWLVIMAFSLRTSSLDLLSPACLRLVTGPLLFSAQIRARWRPLGPVLPFPSPPLLTARAFCSS